MSAFRLKIVRHPLTRAELATEATQGFGEMIKAVVDVRIAIMAIGAELHADEETALMDAGSHQQDLWGSTCTRMKPATSGWSSTP